MKQWFAWFEDTMRSIHLEVRWSNETLVVRWGMTYPNTPIHFPRIALIVYVRVLRLGVKKNPNRFSITTSSKKVVP